MRRDVNRKITSTGNLIFGRMGWMVWWCCLVICSGSLPAQSRVQQSPPSADSLRIQVDLNNARFEDIARLPIPQEMAERIYERIDRQGPFTSVYQLLDIPGMDVRLFLKIKPLVRIEPYVPRSEREERIENLYFRLERWEGNEGTNQALIDAWLEQALEPVPINQIRFDQLLNLQGVSPVDAAAIINYRRQVGRISGLRDLRSAPYLSYFGYRNTRNFIRFEPVQRAPEFHGHLLVRMHNTPFFTEEEDATTSAEAAQLLGGQLSQPFSLGISNNNYPDVYTRFMGSYGNGIKVGYSYWHALNEPVLRSDLGFARLPRAKFYLGFENRRLGPVEVRKLYLGNYALAFGEGVVMENTDFFIPRKSGIGFRKRFLGLTGDNSRTRQYKLTGAAAELAFGPAHLFLFGSFDKRDAILNTTPVVIHGKTHFPVNQLIVLDQRFLFAPADDFRRQAGLPWRDVVKELTYGFHAAYDVRPTSQIGITYYESAYNRLLRPNVEEIVDPGNLNQLIRADNEVFNTYGGPISDGENPIWGDALSFRRVYGINFRTVHQNVALQGEYAELDKGAFLSGNPHALVLNAYIQYNSFFLFGLYRDYSLEFDNPYQRSFSNYRRFKRTVFERFFLLQSPFYGQLYSNNPQPQSERGFYFFTRYQVNRKFVLTLENDNWRRVADDATQFRLVGTLNYRPIFPLQIVLRQKYQGREKENRLTTEYFESLEFRGTIRARLSRFDELSLLYMNSVTKFRPRPRLYYPLTPGDSLDTANLAGNVTAPGEALGGSFTHNFNPWLKMRGFLGFYRGFFWNFEDTQFAVVDSERGALRWWVSLYSRLSNQVSVRFKYTRDVAFPINYFHARDTNNVPIPPHDGRYYQARLVQRTQDYYYFEMNVHF